MWANMKNRTRQDAFERITQARVGSLVNSTQEYREALIRDLMNWADDVKQENFRRGLNDVTKGQLMGYDRPE